MVGLAIIGILIVGGAAFWYVRSLPQPVRIEATGPSGAGPGVNVPDGSASPPASPSASPAEIVVHVAGWVQRPGVYRFQAGERVIQAIERAGGARKGADLRSINLAAVLVDAQQVVVARAGVGTSTSTTGSSSGGTSGTPGATPAQELINVNTATLEQLETLSGIGEVLAQRIIDYREEHGPFAAVEDLLNVSGIGDSRLADIRSDITV